MRMQTLRTQLLPVFVLIFTSLASAQDSADRWALQTALRYSQQMKRPVFVVSTDRENKVDEQTVVLGALSDSAKEEENQNWGAVAGVEVMGLKTHLPPQRVFLSMIGGVRLLKDTVELSISGGSQRDPTRGNSYLNSVGNQLYFPKEQSGYIGRINLAPLAPVGLKSFYVGGRIYHIFATSNEATPKGMWRMENGTFKTLVVGWRQPLKKFWDNSAVEVFGEVGKTWQDSRFSKETSFGTPVYSEWSGPNGWYYAVGSSLVIRTPRR